MFPSKNSAVSDYDDEPGEMSLEGHHNDDTESSIHVSLHWKS